MSKSTSIMIFSGPPGSGKGTIAQKCKKELGWTQLSTGDLCRKHIAENTNLGKQIDFAIKSGKLVDDTVIVSMVFEWVLQNVDQEKIIFDGFPRTLAQAELFFDLLNKKKVKKTICVVHFEIKDTFVVDRLSKRVICSNTECALVSSSNLKDLDKLEKIGDCTVCHSDLIKRKDDTLDTVKKRLEVYHKHVDLLFDFYKKEKIELKVIDANRPVEQVFNELKKIKVRH